MSGSFQKFWTLEDALKLREKLAALWQRGLEASCTGPERPVVGILGGGATGVELAAEVAALFDYLRKQTAPGHHRGCPSPE